MPSQLLLKPATIFDAEILLTWRNDRDTLKNSHNHDVVKKEAHIQWLESTLSNPNIKLYIAYENEIPVGTIRADLVDNTYELSWTIAPGTRGKGVGKRMVLLLTHELQLPIRAEVKIGNIASRKIAEYVGMKLIHQKDGIQYFERDTIISQQ